MPRITVDVSFISLHHILPVMNTLMKDDATAVCLIKPQFEAGREKVGKKGVVREKSVHLEVIEKVSGYIEDNGFCLIGLDYSPIKGPEGNIEYLAYIQKCNSPLKLDDINFDDIVEKSHNELRGD